jgi:predicted transposase YdaD
MADKTGARSTDEAFYKLLQVAGESILKLAGIKEGYPYEVQSETLKSKKISPDIVAIPLSKPADVVIMEFQGYHDPFIRHRLSAAASLYCEQKKYSGSLLPVIFYTESAWHRAALPLVMEDSSGAYGIRGQFREIILEELEEEELLRMDPRLVILAPFTASRRITGQELIDKAHYWAEVARKSYPDEIIPEIIDIMALFLLSRFHRITIKEVIEMLNFDLADTAAGKELIQLGEEQGIEKGIKKGKIEDIIEALETKFGWVPEDVIEKINRIDNRSALKHLLRFAIQVDSMDIFKTKLEQIASEL